MLSIGETFDLVVIVREPDPVPEIAFTGDWDYDTPGNPKAIGNGDAWQPDNDTDELWMSYIDDNGANRGAELLSTTIGDVIDVGDLRWSIQSITDEGNWVRFGISPQVQSGTTGVRTFQFETVPDTSLSYEREVDRWLNDDNISGLFGVDTPYSEIIADDNQYGVDIIVQQVSSSPCWEVVAYGGGGGGGGSPTYFMGAGTSGYVVDPVVEEGARHCLMMARSGFLTLTAMCCLILRVTPRVSCSWLRMKLLVLMLMEVISMSRVTSGPRMLVFTWSSK